MLYQPCIWLEIYIWWLLVDVEFSSFFTVKSCRIWPALVLLLFPCTVASDESSLLDGWYDVWFFRFLINVLGYSTIIVPGYLLICYFKRINYLETGWLKRWPPGHSLGLLSVNSIHCFHLCLALLQVVGYASPSLRPVCLAARRRQVCWMTCQLHPGTRVIQARLPDTTSSWSFVLLDCKWGSSH